MPVPMVCRDARVRPWAARFAACSSTPQSQHGVSVLLGLLWCQEARTLSGLLRQVAGGPSVASLSRFLARASGEDAVVARAWRARFDARVAPVVPAVAARRAPTAWRDLTVAVGAHSPRIDPCAARRGKPRRAARSRLRAAAAAQPGRQ